MATVRVTRSNEYMNRFRNYGIYIDGVKVGSVSNNDQQTFEVTAGQHTIYAKLDWRSSPEHTFTAGDKLVAYTVGGFKGLRWYSLAFIILFLARIPIEKMAGTTVMLVVEVAVMVAFIAVLVAMRKKHLVLAEEETSSDYVPYSGK